MNERILIVDDEVNVLRAYRRAFYKRFSVDTAGSGQEALALIAEQGPYAVVVSDMRMPGMDGIELLQRIRESAPHTLRIMLTGNADQQTAVDAVNRGQVYRFLNKPCSIESMAQALESALAAYRRESSERTRASEAVAAVQELSGRLILESRQDSLTGLNNRVAFEEALADTGAASDSGHALLYLDLDLFRAINDGAGHVAGDALLRQTAQVLSAIARRDDILARVSSDEFALLRWGAQPEEAAEVAVRINRELGAIGFAWDGQRYEISTCVGIVPLRRKEISSAAQTLAMAETACHVAREAGRGQVHIGCAADPAMTHRLNEAQWVTRISRALREDAFRLYYQPILPVDKAPGGDHYELLLRLCDGDEVLSPSVFMPAAEHYHLSPLIDLWVVRTLVRWLGANPEALARLEVCSINLSGHSLGNAQVLDGIRQSFQQSGVSPKKICFEVTETVAIANLNNAMSFIGELKASGFSFSLDDFGSGMSSFAYLRTLPVDYLKIDGMFVRRLDEDAVDRAMVTAIHQVARAMGKKTIAEYVHNAGTLAALGEIGIDFAQGFHLSPPHPLAELADAPRSSD